MRARFDEAQRPLDQGIGGRPQARDSGPGNQSSTSVH
jgi:hypothetical protein